MCVCVCVSGLPFSAAWNLWVAPDITGKQPQDRFEGVRVALVFFGGGGAAVGLSQATWAAVLQSETSQTINQKLETQNNSTKQETNPKPPKLLHTRITQARPLLYRFVWNPKS